MPIENIRSESAHEPAFAAETSIPVQQALTLHELDQPNAMSAHAKLLDWYHTARDVHFENLVEQQLDYDFYDHIQWSDEDRAVLAARHQAPLTYNKIKMALDWVIGTERRTRIDGKVHPREEADVDNAAVKTELLKYLSDTNRVPWERSLAFKDAAIAGIGWTEETVRADRSDEPVMVSHVPWRQMLFDPYSRKLDLSDARFVFRIKHVDVEYAEAMFPQRLGIISRSAHDHLALEEDLGTEMDLPQVWRRYDSRGHEIASRTLRGGRFSVGGSMRLRIRLIECWFRVPKPVKKLWGGEFDGAIFDTANPDHRAAAEKIGQGNTVYSLSDAVTETIMCAIMTDAGLLQLMPSPFKHGHFPFTPYWCYRRDRDGMPYGIVRGVRDAQEDLNKRFSKLLWALSANQLFFEEDAMEEDDVEHNKRELAKPNGAIKLKKGGLNKYKVERNMDMAEGQIKMLELDAAHIHDGSGVNREMLGRDTNAVSGRAILAKQNEGAVSTAELFDNARLAHQLSGEKQLSLTEQFMTKPKQFLIVGERRGMDWRKINQPVWNEAANDWTFENDITRTHADYVVDQQDFRESMRAAYAEQLMEMLTKLPPDMAIQLLDLAVEMSDIPGKDEMVKRIRMINGHGADGDEETPEAAAKRQTETEERQLALRERLAKVGLDEAKTQEISAKVKGLNLGSKNQALQLAELIEILLPLAPAADRLLSDNPETNAPGYPDAA